MPDNRKTLIYCRESRDDYGDNYERIETQRDILLAFCKKRGLHNIVDIIMDDDQSGTNFKRFDKVIERIRRGEIEVIVFKDDSRLGRNLKESLIFIDKLENYGVEIIFENEDYNEDFFPLKAWFNEQRAKDDSKKIRRVLRHKMETGDLIVKPYYGYRVENKELVEDPEAGQVVRDIFNMFLSGKGTNEIASILNANGVPTPSQTKDSKLVCDNWNRQHVYRIIKNPYYIGTMIYGTKKKVSFKNKKVVETSKEDWIIKENHHLSLISKEDFYAAQHMRNRAPKSGYSYTNRPFSGILQCGRCEKNMVLRVRKNRNTGYICSKNHNEGAIKDHIRFNYGCHSHFIREADLFQFSADYIKQVFLDAEGTTNVILSCQQKQENVSTVPIENKIKSVNRIIDQIYDDKLTGLISEKLFQKKYQEYTSQVAGLTAQLNELRNFQSKDKIRNTLDYEKMLDMIEEKTITARQISHLFEKIIIYLPSEITTESARKYDLTDEAYQRIYDNGGIVIIEATTYNSSVLAP